MLCVLSNERSNFILGSIGPHGRQRVKLNKAGYLLPWGPMDPMVYDAVFIFYAISVYLRFVILYLVEDQLNLGKVR